MSGKGTQIIVESSWIELALDIAQMAHLGQIRRGDKSPYITHPVRVQSIAKSFGYSRLVQISAILHDAIEDANDPAYIARVIQLRLPKIFPIVKALTHDRGRPYNEYLLSLSGFPLQVKMCDMLHNLLDEPSDRQRLKYKKALEILFSARKGKPSEIHTNHWKILLKQVGLTSGEVAKNLQETPALLRQYIRLVAEVKMIPEAEERFNLRQSADAILSPLFQIADEILAKKDGKAFSNFEIDSSFNGLEMEVDYVNDNVRGNTVIEIAGDSLINDLDTSSRFDIDIKIKAGEKLFINADFHYDPDLDVDDDAGNIISIVRIPTDMIEDYSTRQKLHRKLRGAVAHEFQHLIQRVMLGTLPPVSAGTSLENHMRDPGEIDARVEEIIAACEEEHDLCDIDGFKKNLEEYVDEYFERNNFLPSHPKYKKYRREMIDSHLIKYREKFGLWG